MKKNPVFLLLIVISACMISACGINETSLKDQASDIWINLEDDSLEDLSADEFDDMTAEDTEISTEETSPFDLTEIPDFSGQAYTEINGNIPYFTSNEITVEPFETYSPLDQLGRCGVAYANICKELMPTEERGEIGMIKPSGWHTQKYPGIVEGGFAYNRCHLIGFRLAGENANERNLITGTRYMNVDGMLPFEKMVADYIYDHPDNHVLYRVTPMFDGEDLVAHGVLMEAYSVEDDGAGVSFCIYCYNSQPGLCIDYRTGETSLDEDYEGEYAVTNQFSEGNNDTHDQPYIAEGQGEDKEVAEETTYIINTNTGKFHYPTCSSVKDMASKNVMETTETRDQLVNEGYSPCGRCNP